MTLPKQFSIGGFALKSGGDNPGRDPTNVIVYNKVKREGNENMSSLFVTNFSKNVRLGDLEDEFFKFGRCEIK